MGRLGCLDTVLRVATTRNELYAPRQRLHPRVPPAKRTRVQAYLDAELAELVLQRAASNDRSTSRELTRLVRLGLSADTPQCNSEPCES